MSDRSDERANACSRDGLALIAVLIALSLLLALTAPFLLSMEHGDAASMELADRKQVELLSASARDIVLQQAERTHESLDEHPSADDLAEFPSALELPAAFDGLRRGEFNDNLLSAETEDLQRRVNLNTATPLLIANLLGLSARLRQDHAEDADEIAVDDTSGFPDQGYIIVDRELIRYGRREGNAFADLERGLLAAERGYETAAKHALARDTLVLDFRAVLAVTHSFYHQGDDRRDQRVPLSSVDQLTRIEELGFGGFAPEHMDVLRKYGTVGSVRECAADWGLAQRVFEPVEVGADPWQGRELSVRSANDLGGGTVVRIRSTDGKHVEYALCWGTMEVGGGTVNLPGQRWALRLLRPPSSGFEQFETVVEALLPHPINLNTASQEVLAALVEGVRGGPRARAHGDRGNRVFGRAEAETLARELRALRGDQDRGAQFDEGVFAGAEVRPFDSFEDLAQRYFGPRMMAVDPGDRGRWMRLYRAMSIGRPGDLEMGTAPITFTSAPLVSYRAAAMATRAGKTAARLERSGTAVVMPGTSLGLVLSTQRDFEERFRLDRRAPFYTTHPINLGSWIPFDPGANPPSRTVTHLLPMAMPDLGFGEPRFPSVDGVADAFVQATAHTPFPSSEESNLQVAQESMWTTYDPEGRNVAQEGPYEMFNAGPRTATPGGGSPPTAPRTGSKAHQPTFPYTVDGGMVGAHAVSFWFKPRATSNQMLFDLSADDEIRNRIAVKLFENELVFEVIDEAGVDEDQQAIARVGTSPERAAGTWKVPLTEFDLQADIWYHVNLSAFGNRPSQLSMLIDGVPRGDPGLRTTLSASIQEYVRPSATSGPFWNDRAKYLEVRVESTEGFPPQGVLRIGLELFEYTALTPSSFLCAFGRGHPVHNSYGGRVARMNLQEFAPSIPVDPNTGQPTINIEQITGGANLNVAPPHERGSAVELYGYAVPVYRDFAVQVGSGRLTSALSAFAVARVINSKTSIDIPLQNGSIPLGTGLDADEVVNIELGDPLAGADSKPASEAISSTFATSGGYALLVQTYIPGWTGTGDGGAAGGSVDVGGIELIRYTGRSGSSLTGIQRGVKLPAAQRIPGAGGDLFDGTSRKFVGNWRSSVVVTGPNETIPAEELPQFLAYVVPVSIPVSGGALDPTIVGRSEFVQLYPQGGDEADTEFVRYDYLEGDWLVRSAPRAWENVYGQLISPGERPGSNDGNNRSVTVVNELSRTPYPVVTQDGIGYIGYTEQVEVDFPQIQLARRSLQFRGDPLTGTTSHSHRVNDPVLPVHRTELDWGNYGAMGGRAGRNDRVALVGGTQASGSNRPPVEWHTVNWVFRRQSFDNPPSSPGGATSVNEEKLGAYPCQFVAFQKAVGQLFVGPARRNFEEDVRLVDRLIKFPSGELPAAAPENGLFGSTAQKDVPDFGGVLDELVVTQRLATPLLLDEPFGETAGEFVVRKDLLVTPQGWITPSGADYTANFNTEGGLVSIDGEILAYETLSSASTQTARFKIAQNGRGLLDPERQAYAHDEGAMVYFLEHVPAAILSSGISENSAELVVRDMGNLPRHGGTLLVGGNELLHYAWSTGRQLLEMPVWFDPAEENTEGRGLFRGRFGTTPVSAQAGEPVIWFPFRYWDRYHERADDPELAYFQVTWSLAPVYLKSLYWQEEEADALVDVQCLFRVDGLGSFADDPEKRDGLFSFTDGAVNQQPNPLNWQGSRFEARFMTVYKPGAFDPTANLSHSWKKTPKVRAVVVDYEGEGRVLSERITAR